MEALDQYQTVTRWRRIAYDEIRISFRKRKIAENYLLPSIYINILPSGDDVSRVSFIFDAYGRFIDMGVGRGWKIGGRREAMIRKAAGEEISKPRSRKQFYSRTIFHQGHRLHEIMVKMHGIKMMTSVEWQLDGGKIKIAI